MFISKNKFNKKAKPQTIDSYNIETKANGKYKKLKDYKEEDLIKVLHLAKTIVDNSHKIVVASSDLQNVPVHRIKYFSEVIMKELNSR